jgi:hypothetical protein
MGDGEMGESVLFAGTGGLNWGLDGLGVAHKVVNL